MGVCNCSMLYCALLYVHSSIAIILIGKRELVALLGLSSWCLVVVRWLFVAMLWGCLRFVIVVFTDHTHLLFKTWLLFQVQSHLLLGIVVYDASKHYAGSQVSDRCPLGYLL